MKSLVTSVQATIGSHSPFMTWGVLSGRLRIHGATGADEVIK
jgi:hypothetical protein